MADPLVAAVPVVECGEPLADLRDTPALLLDTRLADSEGAYAHLRESLVPRLLHAQRLLPDGLRLLVVEGYRPMWLQELYFTEYADELRRDNPGWSPELVHRQASRSLAPPSVAPHVAGAAVDLTVATRGGEELDMGTDVNASPEESDGACYTEAPNLTEEARRNRAVLGQVMSAAGFINYPTEWWHWSRGDRYWALSTGRQQAQYGPIPWAT